MDRSLYKISNLNQMDPFLMTITSGSDHWMYLSSTGCLTAGRIKAEYALFPYVTDDLLHRNGHFTGPVTVIRINDGDKNLLWRPFSIHDESYEKECNLYKNSLGDTVIFEEINKSLGLTFFYKWQSSTKYGFVRKSKLINNSQKILNVELIDGLQNIMPANIELRTQQGMSNLANAYKVSEYTPDTNCALFFLNALLMDRPEPGESLYTNIIWSYYGGEKIISLSEKDIVRFTNDGTFNGTHIIKGKPGCFLTKIKENINPNNEIYWYTIADVQKSQSDVTHLICGLNDSTNIELKLKKSTEENHQLLEGAVGSADGYQCTNETINDLHHTANSMFNLLRGGVFLNNYDLNTKDFLTFLNNRNKPIFEQYYEAINSLPNKIGLNDLVDFGDQTKDPSLRRLCREYLPLTMGRRHGDPSRPWNRFEIRTRDEYENQLFYYEGNWRDIFQNWEALGYSYPLTWESMVSKFLNATTTDGYNPYRITSDGIDWEISDPDDPWSFIGYWNDHQIIYLSKLLENLYNQDPPKIEHLLQEPIFSYANVPYRIRNFGDIAENPKETIDFDFEEHSIIEETTGKLGHDGKLVLNKNGTVYHVNLGEKILVLILAKICNLIPGGGIWLNTQRPEWNDANNALVGYGTSMVTVYYMKRFLSFFNSVLEKTNHKYISASTEVVAWILSVNNMISKWQDKGNSHIVSNQERMEYITQLGTAFSEYRTTVYKKGFSGQKELSIKTISSFISLIINELDNTIQLGEDSNGFYHAYNTINLDLKNKSTDIKHLNIMLEGQVAALSSGALNIDDTIKLLQLLFKSELYREDMHSFILYPEKVITPFLHKNIIPPQSISKSELFSIMLQKKDRSLIEIDAEGQIRFRPEFKNSFDLAAKLNQLKNESSYNDLAIREYDLVMEVFEKVFDHRNYTGRSGTMFSYEGIGSIYWHMISKLLLAVQENYFQAIRMNEPLDKLKKLGHLYYDIRSGLSAAKTPEEYGAFPYDPYSHTPAHSGAQQPGMTGQVKEEVLTRFGELGCLVDRGILKFEPSLLQRNEFLFDKRTFEYYDVLQQKHQLVLQKNQLAYTFCQIPVIYTLSNKDSGISLLHNDGSKIELEGNQLNKKQSDHIFNRDNIVTQISVSIYPKTLFD
ncbi:MAG: hypothetical protein HOG73_10935 [Candidatus Marinimicrobia bacterium]|nr:hypothetical protein [Candidatus Neomarinimicrobiota bacterium]